MKKALFVLTLAIQFFVATSSITAHEPIPECFPCEVR